MADEKLVFDINEYDGSHVMRCKNEQDALTFFEYLHNAGETWSSGKPYTGEGSRKYDPTKPCYRFRAGTYDSVEFFVCNDDYIILDFDWFDWERSMTKDLELSYEELFN